MSCHVTAIDRATWSVYCARCTQTYQKRYFSNIWRPSCYIYKEVSRQIRLAIFQSSQWHILALFVQKRSHLFLYAVLCPDKPVRDMSQNLHGSLILNGYIQSFGAFIGKGQPILLLSMILFTFFAVFCLYLCVCVCVCVYLPSAHTRYP